MYLTPAQLSHLSRLLRTFFSIPYSTDLDGKDAETLIRIAKGATETRSRRKELFDIVEGDTGYSVKTLRKRATATRVDLQEQRFCDVEVVRSMRASGDGDAAAQGEILLRYMRARIQDEMQKRGVTHARSIILLKDWNTARTAFTFRYWEEDFLGFIDNLVAMNARNELEWVLQSAGLHARDLTTPVGSGGKRLRLLRMHYKHNQIFTDHDIPEDAHAIEFTVPKLTWDEMAKLMLN